MRKIIFATMVFALIIFSITTNANDLTIDQSILNRIKNLGIESSKIELELEPEELLSYEEYSKICLHNQKTDEASWSTIWHNNLDKLDITTKSSSTLKGYPITNLFDKKINTAWVEGVKGDGIGEWISIRLDPQRTDRPTGLLYFGIIPGYLKSDQTWQENNRVKSALLVIERYAGYDLSTESSRYDYPILRLKFKDFRGLQVFDLLDYGAPPTFATKKIWLIIEGVYKGIKYDDTCVSEIVITGTCAPDDP